MGSDGPPLFPDDPHDPEWNRTDHEQAGHLQLENIRIITSQAVDHA